MRPDRCRWMLCCCADFHGPRHVHGMSPRAPCCLSPAHFFTRLPSWRFCRVQINFCSLYLEPTGCKHLLAGTLWKLRIDVMLCCHCQLSCRIAFHPSEFETATDTMWMELDLCEGYMYSLYATVSISRKKTKERLIQQHFFTTTN
jgi:hypothetical protein